MAGKLVVVLDACLSWRLARMLAGFHEGYPKLEFKAMKDFHHPSTPDAEWLVGFPETPPHIILTKDEALLRESSQLRAWIRGGLTVIIFGAEFSNLKREEMAAYLFRWLPTMIRTAQQFPAGRAFSVPARYTEMNLLPDYVPPAYRRRPRQVAASTKDKPKRAEKSAVATLHSQQLSLLFTPNNAETGKNNPEMAENKNKIPRSSLDHINTVSKSNGAENTSSNSRVSDGTHPFITETGSTPPPKPNAARGSNRSDDDPQGP